MRRTRAWRRFGAAAVAVALVGTAMPAEAGTHLQWDKVFHGPADLGVAISATDLGNGHVYTVAAFNANGSQQTVEVRAYSNAGAQLWAATLAAAKQSIERPLTAAVDPVDHRLVVVTKTAASAVIARSGDGARRAAVCRCDPGPRLRRGQDRVTGTVPLAYAP